MKNNEIARIGFINDELEVYVQTDDSGKMPHIHIRNIGTQGHNYETCVRIDKNEYFLHGSYTDRLNSSEKKDLAKFMASKPKSKRYNTNYELAVDMWNLNNSDITITPLEDTNGNIIIPDYTNIPG